MQQYRMQKGERAYVYGLPEYLQHDLDAYKEGLKTKSDLLDCLRGELYGSINIAEINDGAITREHAWILQRNKSIFSEENMTGTIDFTNCKKILGRAYNGANGKKITVEYNGREYMLKFPPSGAAEADRAVLYEQFISEHIASSIL